MTPRPVDRTLRTISRIVPRSLRDEWLMEWLAELHHARATRGRTAGRFWLFHRYLGAMEDACWLRFRKRERTMILHDLKFALRSMRKNPVFTIVVVGTLALGIGANTAIFTLVDTVLLRPLPVRDAGQLADIYTTCRRGFPYCSSSYPDFVDYRANSHTFADMAAFATTRAILDEGSGGRFVQAVMVTGSYFDLLGVSPAVGRTILPDDDHLGSPRNVVVVSHNAWRDQFGEEPEILGRSVRLNGVSFTIVGVAPKGFRGTRLGQSPALWIPMSALPALSTGPAPPVPLLQARGSRWIDGVIARKRSGVTIEQARADMLAISDRLEEHDPARRGGRGVTVEPTRTMTLPASSTDDIVRFVALLIAVVGVTLVIACANIASLQLARASARQREIGVRLAIGAGRARLLKQLLTESLILSAGGAALGLVVAHWSLKMLSSFSLPGFVTIDVLDLSLDGRVLAFTAGLSLLAGLGFGLAPALQTTRFDLTEVLKEQAEAGRTRSVTASRGALLAVQTALAFVLLVGAGLFVRSLQNGMNADVGFETRRLSTATSGLGLQRYSVQEGAEFVDQLIARAEQLPGVRSVSTSVYPPLALWGAGRFAEIEGYDRAPDEEIRVELNWVGPNYFRTMGIPIRGRDIVTEDHSDARLVAVINETMANRYWEGRDPIGASMVINESSPITVVGVASDVTYGLDQPPEPFVYLAVAQEFDRAMARTTLLVATEAPPAQTLPQLRRVVQDLDARMPLIDLSTLENRFAELLMPQRMGSLLLSSLGILASLLAAIGVFGVVGFAVNQRKREIGIRLALGASRRHVLGIALRSALVPVGVGVGVGLGGALAVTRLAESFMFDVTPTDPMTLAGVALAMVAVASTAAYLPGRRAIKLNPTQTLRSE